MKILWVKSDLLHPTTKGGHIRTLEMLKRLHARHELHYVGFENDLDGEGVRRSSEYCSRVYPIGHVAPKRTSPRFAAQLVKGVVSPLPVAISRYRSEAMRRCVTDLLNKEKFHSVVCDFITPAINFPVLSSSVLFQHNVETMIWRRHAQNARSLPERLYLELQARRMFQFEQEVCRAVRHIIAVSREDARSMEQEFGVANVSSIATGVDIEYFEPKQSEPRSGLVFAGSMDWLPNIDGMRFFLEKILPVIRLKRPDCKVTIVGREPTREVRAWAERDSLVEVTGTVPDIRPFLWRSAVSIVPLRIGGGTRMKIYEAMAAKTPVVTTSVGMEGLDVHAGTDLQIADTPEQFAADCLRLLDDRDAAQRQAEAAWHLVAQNFGWDRIASQFEAILQAYPAHQSQPVASSR